MTNRLTSLVMLGSEACCHAPVWECLESCCRLSDDLMVCDLGMPLHAEKTVAEFSRVKRKLRVEKFYDVADVLETAKIDSKWIVFVFGDEVVHEDSMHYIWDLVSHHGDSFDGAAVPVHVVFASWYASSEHGVGGYRDIRLVDSQSTNFMAYDGTRFFLPDSRIAPMELNPKPIWKLLMAFSSADPFGGIMPPYPFGQEHEQAVPASLRRFLGRVACSSPYIQKDTFHERQL